MPGHLVSAGYVSTVNDLARISYPADSGRGADYSFVLLAEPQSFPKEGIYIWRDSNGLWCFYVNSSKLILPSNVISTDGALIALAEDQINKNQISAAGTAVTNFSASNEFKYRVTGTYAEINLKSDASIIRKEIFIGRSLVNPKSIPFRIENVKRTLNPQQPLSRSYLEGQNKSASSPGQSVPVGGGKQ